MGEALYKTTFEKQFNSQDEAYKRLAEAGGSQFLIDLTAGTPPAIWIKKVS